MTRREKLSKDAKAIAAKRGHRLGYFKGQGRATATCFRCSKEAHIIEVPQPNEIAISGEAIATGCSR